jgi:hypothetical protein
MMHSSRIGAAAIDLFRLKAGEDMKGTASTGDSHIQATLTTRFIQGSEIHGKHTIVAWSEAEAEEDLIALISLHCLQIFHEAVI